MNTPGDPELLTPRQVAELFAVSAKTAARWAYDGRVPAIRTPGGRLRFRRTDIDTFLEREATRR